MHKLQINNTIKFNINQLTFRWVDHGDGNGPTRHRTVFEYTCKLDIRYLSGKHCLQ